MGFRGLQVRRVCDCCAFGGEIRRSDSHADSLAGPTTARTRGLRLLSPRRGGRTTIQAGRTSGARATGRTARSGSLSQKWARLRASTQLPRREVFLSPPPCYRLRLTLQQQPIMPRELRTSSFARAKRVEPYSPRPNSHHLSRPGRQPESAPSSPLQAHRLIPTLAQSAPSSGPSFVRNTASHAMGLWRSGRRTAETARTSSSTRRTTSTTSLGLL